MVLAFPETGEAIVGIALCFAAGSLGRGGSRVVAWPVLALGFRDLCLKSNGLSGFYFRDRNFRGQKLSRFSRFLALFVNASAKAQSDLKIRESFRSRN